jgi:peptide deformylase
MYQPSRRRFLACMGGASLSLMTGCASQRRISCVTGTAQRDFEWNSREIALLEKKEDFFPVVTTKGPLRSVLRTRARTVRPAADLERVASRREMTMNKAGGVGIAGPQVGLNVRVATLKLDYKEKNSRTIFACNPFVVERSDATEEGYEGCLSIPGVGGVVRRNSWVGIAYNDVTGKRIETEARGYNAVLWQHELDHLDGVLYVDKLLGELLPMDEVRRLRRELEEQKSNQTAWDGRRLGPSQTQMVAML